MIALEDIILVESGQLSEAAVKRLQTCLDDSSIFRVWTPYNDNLFLRNIGILVRNGVLKCEAIKSMSIEGSEN